MKTDAALFPTCLAMVALLAGCGQSPQSLAGVHAGHAAPTALSHRAPGLHGQVHAFWYFTGATFQADPTRTGLGTRTFTLHSLEGATLTLAVVTFYNAAPRVTHDAILVKLDGEQLLDETHIADAHAILAGAHPYHSVNGHILDEAVAALADTSLVRY